MAIFNGTIYKVQTAAITGGVVGTYSALSDQTEGSISLSMETRDATTKDSSGFRDLEEGLRSASISVSGLVSDGSGALTTLTGAMLGATRDKIAVKFGLDEGADGDDDFFTVQGWVTSIETSAGTEDNVSYSATIECTGTIAHDSADGTD